MDEKVLKRRVLVFGRFQPFHYGHLMVIKWALTIFDEVVVLVGMADESHTLQNPFTAGERIWMIREALRSEDVDLSRIITATIPTMSIYVGNALYVIKLVPPVEAIITRNPVTAQVFRDAGLKVIVPPPFNREIYRGSYIRELIIKGDEKWRELVPPIVAEIIDYVNGVERIRNIARYD